MQRKVLCCMSELGNRFSDSHGGNLPTIRIAKIELNHFKSVDHGVITLNCGKKYIPYGTQSDILGIYGQNGSGKTTVIEAISVLKYLLSGKAIPDRYTDCISVSSDYAEAIFTFDVQYPVGNEYMTNGDVRKVVYSFKLRKEEKQEKDETPRIFADPSLNYLIPVHNFKVVVYDEVIKISGTICGSKTSLQPFVDTSNESTCLEPQTKARLLIGKTSEKKRSELIANMKLARTRSSSYVFMKEMMTLYNDNSEYSYLYQQLLELQFWGTYYLFVVDDSFSEVNDIGSSLPMLQEAKNIVKAIPTTRSFILDEENYNAITLYMQLVSGVLSEIVPGFSLIIKDLGNALLKDGQTGHSVEIVSCRNGAEIPFRSESRGIKRLVFTIGFLIQAYNQQSATIAYDEFDSGIFEYLLGELLQVMQLSGKGQFIFTSHNMRPLEVLNKEFVWFTTVDSNNRYVKLTGLGETNNLRRVYYREIAMHEHFDNLYNETKRNRIIAAMRKVDIR